MEIQDAVPFLSQALSLAKEVRSLFPKDKLSLSGKIEPFSLWALGLEDTEAFQVKMTVINPSHEVVRIKKLGLLIGESDFQFQRKVCVDGNHPVEVPKLLEPKDSFDISGVFLNPELIREGIGDGHEALVYLIDGLRRFAWGEVEVAPSLIQT